MEKGGDAVPVVLPGFRFCPSDEILVSYYLKNKVEGKDSEFSHLIPEIDVGKHEPCDVPAFFKEPDFPDHEREWIFFSRPDYKYINSSRCNRATVKGFYKITGKEREIKARGSKAVIAKKRTLTFYLGRAPKATKTDWVLHEFYFNKTQLVQLGLNPDQQRNFVLCRLKDKSADYKKKKDDSICDKSAEPGSGGCIASNPVDDQAATSNDMNLDREEHLGHNGVLCNDNHDDCAEFPNGSCLINNNDISTCDDEETDDWVSSLFDHQAADDMFKECCAEQGENLDSLFPPPQPPHPHQSHQPHEPPQLLQPHQPPEPQDYCSSTLQSPLYTKHKQHSLIGDNESYVTHKINISTNDHNEPVFGITYSFQDRGTDESISEVYHNSTNYDNEPVSNIDYHFQIQATVERISEAYIQPEENLGLPFHASQLQDYTLLSPMNTELGDLCMPI